MSTRTTILGHYETALNTLVPADIVSVEVNKLDTRDLQDTKLPAIWIFSGAERRAEFKYGQESWDWEIIVQVWARGADMEDLLDKVNSAIYARYVATEFVENLYRLTSELFVVDSDQELQGWSLIYKNFYETDKGTV